MFTTTQEDPDKNEDKAGNQSQESKRHRIPMMMFEPKNLAYAWSQSTPGVFNFVSQ